MELDVVRNLRFDYVCARPVENTQTRTSGSISFFVNLLAALKVPAECVHLFDFFVLKAWNLLSDKQAKCFRELNEIRKRAVHYQRTFAPQTDALSAITNLHDLIDNYFSQFERKDILRVFEIAGEIWVREDKITDPFVKAFVLPNCIDSASRGTFNKERVYHEKDAIVGNFSETDFIEQRKTYKDEVSEEALNYQPSYEDYALEDGGIIKYRLI